MPDDAFSPLDADDFELFDDLNGNHHEHVVSADSITIEQGGAGTVEATHVEINQGGAGRVQAEDVTVNSGGIGLCFAETATLNDSQVGTLLARELHSQNSRSAVLIAQNVYGQVETVVDQRSALLIGVGFGVSVALASFVLGRLLGGRQ